MPAWGRALSRARCLIARCARSLGRAAHSQVQVCAAHLSSGGFTGFSRASAACAKPAIRGRPPAGGAHTRPGGTWPARGSQSRQKGKFRPPAVSLGRRPARCSSSQTGTTAIRCISHRPPEGDSPRPSRISGSPDRRRILAYSRTGHPPRLADRTRHRWRAAFRTCLAPMRRGSGR